MAVFAPIPSANVRIATTVKTGVRRKARHPCRTSRVTSANPRGSSALDRIRRRVELVSDIDSLDDCEGLAVAWGRDYFGGAGDPSGTYTTSPDRRRSAVPSVCPSPDSFSVVAR